jgi:hypothetical protein
MYALASFRLAALDRRVPAAGAVLTLSLASTPSLTTAAAWLVLVAIPLSLIWFLRTAVNHARSFEDSLRRIEHLERAINGIAGADLLGFQSSHPSRGVAVGGRTGVETIQSVAIAAAVMLGSCLWLTWIDREVPAEVLAPYALYLAIIAGYLVRLVLGWRAYRYTARA